MTAFYNRQYIDVCMCFLQQAVRRCLYALVLMAHSIQVYAFARVCGAHTDVSSVRNREQVSRACTLLCKPVCA